jgi:alpha-L-rhamnosidase
MKQFMRKINIELLLFLLLTSSCNLLNQSCGDENGDLKPACWITDNRAWPVADSLMYGSFPAPLFRREFSVKKDVRSATLYITAAGYCNASINGKPAGKNFLEPAWTNFSKRIYYSVYDITSDIRRGKNCIGATVGNGFYNPLPMKMWSQFNLRDYLPVGKPSLIAKLKIVYADGETEEVISDTQWKYSYGPVMKNSVYLGEVYNAANEINGWNLPGFDDSGWKRSVRNDGPGGKPEKSFFPPVRITATFKPVAITSPVKNIFIADMGVNYTGIYRIRLKGNPGDTITLRFGERLYEDGTLDPMTSVAGQIKGAPAKADRSQETLWHAGNGPGCPTVAWQTDSYIFGKNSDTWYSPAFTFHIGRYIEIKGLKYTPQINDLEGLALNSDVENSNSFSCSSELINSIQKAARRTFLDNLVSVQSDCPGRERFGYGGDLNAVCESFMYNFNMQSFYRKTIYDWVDAMKDSVFIDTAPYVGIRICGLSWESAFLITQYKMLLFYNDTALVKELYATDLKWMEKAERLHPSGIVDKGLSDHESLVKVPVKLIGTTHYLDCARIMKRFAGIMNDTANVKKFGKLSDDLTASVREIYWRKPVPDTINRQTLFATLLYYNIVPDNEKNAAADSLMKAVKKARAGHFTTGIFGTKYILDALSLTAGTGTVYNIINSTTFPGWGYMIGHGATTIWETWKESDNTYSNCHPMFGSVSEWFYSWLGGIRPDPENPGFRKFILSPSLPSGLTYVNCSYQTPFGIIRSNWNRSKEGIKYELTVPEGTSASFETASAANKSFRIENTITKMVVVKNAAGPLFRTSLLAGSYLITCK